MGLTTCAGWRRVIRYSLVPAVITTVVASIDHLFFLYRLRRR